MNNFKDFEFPALLYTDTNNNVLARGRCPFNVGTKSLDISFDRRNRFIEEMLLELAGSFTESKSIADLTTCFMVMSGEFSETPLAGTQLRVCNAEHQIKNPLVVAPSLTAFSNPLTKTIRKGTGATLETVSRIRITYQGTTRVDFFPQSFELVQNDKRVSFHTEDELLDFLTWSILPKRPYCDKNPVTLRQLCENKLFPKPQVLEPSVQTIGVWERLSRLQSL